MKNRNGLIDLYRLLFAEVIVSHHAVYLQGRNDGFVPLLGGYSVVEFFFILSGFYLAKKAVQGTFDVNSVGKETWGIIRKKVVSLYPFFIISYLISLALNTAYFNPASIHGVIKSLFSSFGEWSLLLSAGFIFQPFKLIGPIWFFSALLISVLLLYPWIKKYQSFYFTVIAPLLCIFIYGYFAVTSGSIVEIDEPSAVLWGGILRACAGLSMGCIVFHVAGMCPPDLSKSKLAACKTALVLLTVLILYIMNSFAGNYMDFYKVILFSLIVLLSNIIPSRIFNRKLFYHAGTLSAVLYVSHTSLVWLPANKWPSDWTMQYIVWIISTNLLSIIIMTFVKFIFPRAKSFLFRSGKKQRESSNEE